MTGVPVGVLLAVSVVAAVTAVVLGVGEAAFQRLGRSAAAELATRPGRPARTAARLAQHPRTTATAAAGVRVTCEVTLAVCLTLALAAVLTWWQALVVAVVVLATVALLLVRLAARGIARRNVVGAVLATAGVLRVAAAVVAPGRLVDRAAGREDELSDDALRDMVERASDAEHIEEEEREMFRSVLELGDTLTRAVMVPRTEMITLTRGTPLRKALSLFLRSGYSRVPVVGESVDDLLGVLYLKDVVRRRYEAPESDQEPVDTLLRPAVFVPESKPVDDLLREMQQGASHIAMVVDEFGGIAGLVTIEDALEEIVGELTDEHDRAAPEVEELPDGGYRVPARLSVDDLGDLFDLELEDEDVDTVGGLLAKALGKVPLAGSSARTEGLVLTAERVEGRRKQVATVLVRRADAPASPEPDWSQETAR